MSSVCTFDLRLLTAFQDRHHYRRGGRQGSGTLRTLYKITQLASGKPEIPFTLKKKKKLSFQICYLMDTYFYEAILVSKLFSIEQVCCGYKLRNFYLSMLFLNLIQIIFLQHTRFKEMGL